ncbi:MAG TPA: Gldg family protein, partial [Phycisphaerae bacterium]
MALKADNRKPKTENGATHATIDGGQAGNGGARRWLVGTNVVLMTVLALAVAGAVQYGGYQVQNRAGGRWDLTSARTNRLAPATENLLKRLDKKVWITSLYYQSDEEREDQGQYRTRMNDLINLYQLANRAQIEVEFINPVKDHERHEALIKRLSEIPKYRDESAKHVEAIKTFREKIAPQVSQLIESETASARDLARTAGEQRGEILSQLVERVLPNAQSKLAQLQEDVTDALAQTPPRYAALVPEINQFYNDMTKMLNSIATEGPKEAAVGKLSAEVAAFYNGAKDRYRDAINAMNAGVTQTQNLPNLELETLVQQLQRGLKTNPLVVSTAEDATVIPFEEIWPPVDPNMPPSVVGYKDREFRGEEKITSAILKLTSKEKTAVVFVRYGGQPLFGMGMPWQGTPHGTMTNLKERLEEANFQIEEWDLQSQPQQPPINPAPKRSIYVVL